MRVGESDGRLRGFTLVEMLVVITIIAALSALLMPVFAQARERSRQTVCLSNSRQLALAMALYSESYDEMTVVVWREISVPCPLGWANKLAPYVRSDGVFLCPSGPKVVPGDIAACNAGPNLASNYYFARGLPLASLETPTQLLVIAEAGVADWFHNGSLVRSADTLFPWERLRCAQQYDAYDPILVKKGWTAWAIHWRHQGGANFTFADGHAKWRRQGTLKPENIYPDTPPEEAYAPCTLE